MWVLCFLSEVTLKKKNKKKTPNWSRRIMTLLKRTTFQNFRGLNSEKIDVNQI